MQKISNVFALRNLANLKVISVMALFSAISVIAGKFLAIPGGEIMRFSFENLPIILSGILFGPVCGMLTGAVADLVGCVLVGYAINPVVTVGAAVIGFAGGFVYRILPSRKLILPLSLSVLSAHILGSVIIKSIGLSKYMGMPLEVTIAWRGLNYLIVGIAEFAVLYILLRHSGFRKLISNITGDKL